MEEKLQPASVNSTHLLFTLLVLMSFFLGYFWSKSQSLEKSTVQANTQASLPNYVAAAAPAPLVSPTPTSVEPAKIPVITSEDHIRGNKNATLTLVEYSDMECPFCKRFHPTMQQVIKEYGDKVNWVYRHFPLSFHTNAQKEAEASECAAKLGGDTAFWTFVDKILERTTSNGTGFALTELTPLATEIGLNGTKFQSCLDSGEMTQKIKDQQATGTGEGVTGTPGTILVSKNGNSRLIPGAVPFEQLKQYIDSAIN